jgi:hypothetical protein
MPSQLTAGRRVVVVSGDLRGLVKCANRVSRLTREFIKRETVEQWKWVKPAYEAAPPHLKKRLGRLTIKEAAEVLRAQTRSAANLAASIAPVIRSARARAPRRSVRAGPRRARAPGRQDASDSEADLPPAVKPRSALPAGLDRVLGGGA